MKRKLKEMTCAFLDFSDIFDKIAIVFRKKHVTCEKKVQHGSAARSESETKKRAARTTESI